MSSLELLLLPAEQAQLSQPALSLLIISMSSSAPAPRLSCAKDSRVSDNTAGELSLEQSREAE